MRGARTAPTRCKAKGKTSKKPCGNRPMAGQDICRMHGGNAPQVKAAAAVRVAEDKARTALAKLSGKARPIGNVLEELHDVAAEVVEFKDIMRLQVAELRYVGYSGEAGEQVRASVVVFERAMDRAVSVLATIARLNIDERLAAMGRAQGDQVFAAVRDSLAEPDAALTREQQRAVLLAFARRVQPLTGPKVIEARP